MEQKEIAPMSLSGDVLLHAPVLFNEKLTPAKIVREEAAGVWVECDTYEFGVRRDVQTITADDGLRVFVPFSSIAAIIRVIPPPPTGEILEALEHARRNQL